LAATANRLLISRKSIKKIYIPYFVCAPEAALFTMAEAEAKHEQLKQEMRRIRRAIRTNEDIEGLEEALRTVRAQATALAKALERQRELTAYLMMCDCFGGPQ
jgi:hypothetical protein